MMHFNMFKVMPLEYVENKKIKKIKKYFPGIRVTIY